MTIKVRTEQIIDLSDWDDLVVETYGRVYSFQQQDNCKERQHFPLTVPSVSFDFKRHTIPEIVNGNEMGVSFVAWLARDPKQPLNSPDKWDREHGLNLFWERNFYPNVSMIANDLHAKGLLPAGDYIIDIDW